jgi:hypothetical protein
MRTFYEPPIRALFTADLLGKMPPDLRAQLGEVQLEMPAEFRADLGVDPAQVIGAAAFNTGQVILPLRTVRWLAEYCGAAAYFQRDRCPNWLMALLVYDGLLAARRAGSNRPPGPLAAFGLDRSIYQDPFVDNVSSKLLSSMLFFILAHELGHIAHHHKVGPSVLADASQKHEREADAYALEIMAQIHLQPLGLALLFGAAAMMEGGQSTHPMSGSRARAAAAVVNARSADFVDRFETNPITAAQRLKDLSVEVGKAMELADDPQIRNAIARNVSGVSWPPSADMRAFACQP